MVTKSYGITCDKTGAPYINNCGVDVAGQILQQIYGSLAQPGTAINKNIQAFDQQKFFVGGDSAQMDPTGHVYIPEACAQGALCKLHIAIEGCLQDEDQIQDQFYTHAGYNEWAQSNNIIVIYPQVKSGLGNPYECWDWWGYTDSNYYTKSGKQVAAVNGMIDWVLAGNSLPPSDPCLSWRIWYYMCKWID